MLLLSASLTNSLDFNRDASKCPHHFYCPGSCFMMTINQSVNQLTFMIIIIFNISVCKVHTHDRGALVAANSNSLNTLSSSDAVVMVGLGGFFFQYSNHKSGQFSTLDLELIHSCPPAVDVSSRPAHHPLFGLSGESGLGKSTLINSLFLTDLYSPEYPGPSHRIKKTVQVRVAAVFVMSHVFIVSHLFVMSHVQLNNGWITALLSRCLHLSINIKTFFTKSSGDQAGAWVLALFKSARLVEVLGTVQGSPPLLSCQGTMELWWPARPNLETCSTSFLAGFADDVSVHPKGESLVVLVGSGSYGGARWQLTASFIDGPGEEPVHEVENQIPPIVL